MERYKIISIVGIVISLFLAAICYSIGSEGMKKYENTEDFFKSNSKETLYFSTGLFIGFLSFILLIIIIAAKNPKIIGIGNIFISFLIFIFSLELIIIFIFPVILLFIAGILAIIEKEEEKN